MTTQKKILIIDDDQRNIFALKATLKAKKFNCISTTDAREGIRLLKETNDIDIILIDMMMPEMDGYEAMPKIKSVEGYTTTPVIAVTAQAMKGDKEKCLEAGADNYISKPIDVDVLMNMLSNYLT